MTTATQTKIGTERFFRTTAGWTSFEEIYADFIAARTMTDFIVNQDESRWKPLASALRARAIKDGHEVWQGTQRTKSRHLIKRHVSLKAAA